MLDLKIVDGTIIDGSGKPRYNGDVGITDGRIVAIGKIEAASRQTIDAAGRIVAPGFIDVHTHYDAQVLWDRTLSPSCFHGVTTVFGGMCGFSITPLTPAVMPYLRRMLARVEGMPLASLEEGAPWNWTSFAEYLARLDGRVGINVGFLAGHCAIRCVAMGEEAARTRSANIDELDTMKKLLARCLEQGALGFSSTTSNTHNDHDGLPVPSRRATREELIALAGVCRKYEGTSLSFIPGIGEFSKESIELMVDMSVAASRPLNWTALNAGDRAFVRRQLAVSDIARRKGGDIIAITTPQEPNVRINFLGGVLLDAFGGWAFLFELPVEERIRVLTDPKKRAELDQSAQTDTPEPFMRYLDWASYIVDSVFERANKPYEGRRIGEIAAEKGATPFGVMLDIAITDRLRTSFLQPSTDIGQEIWKQRAEIWNDDRAVIGASDAGAHLDMIDDFAYTTQVLSDGVRRYAVISLEQAIRQMTYVPAQLYGLRERGLLLPNYCADVVVLDADKVGRGPAYIRDDVPGGRTRVYADAIGVDHVLVNGVAIVCNGQHTGALPGKVLRSGTDTQTPRMPIDAGASGGSS